MINQQQKQVINRCQDSVSFFLRNFVKTKHPSAGIIPFNPFKYQTKALKAFRNHRFTIFRKCRQCFSCDSMVWGPNGPKRIDSINIGDLVYSYNKILDKLEIVPVDDVFDNGIMDCVNVVSKTGHRSTSTADHLYYTTSGSVESGALSKDDTLLEISDFEYHEIDASESEAILLGYMITNGHYDKIVHFTSVHYKCMMDFQKHLRLKFNIDGKIVTHTTENDNPTSWRIYVDDNVIKDWLRSFNIYGKINSNKILPKAVFRWNNKSISIMLNRMFVVNGWHDCDYCGEFGTSHESIQILHQIKQLLSRFHIDSYVYSTNKVQISKLKICGLTSFRNFCDKIGIFDDTLKQIQSGSYVLNAYKGKVEKIYEVGKKIVYDISVPPHNNYVVDGVVVHNSGASKISGAFALWFSMFFNHKTVLIVSRTDEDAITFLSENITFPFKHTPEWMQNIWAPVKNNEHEIQFPNGSKIKSLTSHPDVLRSNASSLNIIDESAFIRDMGVMWAAGFPTLQHGGCLAPDSLISTQMGIEQIINLCDKHIVKTDNSSERTTDTYINGVADTLRLVTSDGYCVESTLDHKFRILNESGYMWKKARELNIGDSLMLSAKPFKSGIPVVLDRQVFSNHLCGCACCGCDYDEQLLRKLSFCDAGLCASCLATQRMTQPQLNILDCDLDLDFAGFIGIFVGNGFYDKHGCFGISCDHEHKDFIEYLHGIIETRFGAKASDEITADNHSVRFNHKALSLLLQHNGITKRLSRSAFVPQCILRAESHIRCAFLRGLFEMNGLISKHCVMMNSGSWQLVHQVQVMLLDFGIRSRLKSVTRKNWFGKNPQYALKLKTTKDVERFRATIGFLSTKKSDCLAAIKDDNRYQKDKYYHHINEFYQSSRGLSNKIRQRILSCRTKGIISRWLVYDLAQKYEQLASTILGKLALDELFSDELVSIDAGRCETYDLTVEPSHCYVANGFISHNSVIVVSTCVHPDTYIWTNNGLQQIKDLEPKNYDGYVDGYSHVNYDGPSVLGQDGLEMPSKFYKRQIEETKKIKLTYGYNIEASLRHKIQIIDSNGTPTVKLVRDLTVGDWLPIVNGFKIFGNNDPLNYIDSDITFEVENITTDLAYLLGVVISNGCVDDNGITIKCRHADVIDKCCAWKKLHWENSIESKDYVAISDQSMLIKFLAYLNIGSETSSHRTIPKRILSCSESVIRGFLQGLFDCDGLAISKDRNICMSSMSYILIEQVRQLLFNYGIMCREETISNDVVVDGNGEIIKSYKLVVLDDDVNRYHDLIGFGANTEQEYDSDVNSKCMPPVVVSILKNLKDTTDLSETKMIGFGLPHDFLISNKNITKLNLNEFISQVNYKDNKYYDIIVNLLRYDAFLQVESLTESESEVYDFTLPNTHTYIGNCLININTNGVGDWYWSTWTDAESGLNDFHPITINWWDMDWTITYKDALSGINKSISPTKKLRKCTTPEEIEKYGPYWSPWLEEQYRALQERGEAWKFKQEILADFVGSGNTVLDPRVLKHLTTCIDDGFKVVKGDQPYVHPVKQQRISINFIGDSTNPRPDEGLWVWRPPNYGSPQKIVDGRVVDQGTAPHRYSMGVDIATGKGKDYFAAEIIDVDEMEQVAELMVHTLPRSFKFMVDYLGRWYNNSMMVVERNNGGDAFIDELRYDLMYPNLWRKKDINDKPGTSTKRHKIQVAAYGFMTTMSSKSKLNKILIDNLRVDDSGWDIYSRRLVKQLQIYIRKKDRSGRDTNKTEAEDGPGNFDDLVIATGLAFIGVHEAISSGSSGLVPFMPTTELQYAISHEPSVENKLGDLVEKASHADSAFLMPMTGVDTLSQDMSAMAELQRFTQQVGAIPIAQNMPSVSARKHGFGKQ